MVSIFVPLFWVSDFDIWLLWCSYVFFFPFQAIGAEYGEGFESFRPNGLLKVDVVSLHLH